MAKNKEKLTVLCTTLLVVGVIVFGLNYLLKNNSDGVEVKYNKIILLGIDGMEPKLIKQLISKGKLPHFEEIAQKGWMSELATTYPPQSPVAWASINTGMNPGKHGLFDFIRKREHSYVPELSLAKETDKLFGTEFESFVREKSFWSYTSDANVPTWVLKWPMAFPPEKIKGNMLSGLGVPDIRGFLSGYTFYTENTLTQKDRKSGKVVHVFRNKNEISSEIKGPFYKKGGKIVVASIPFTILVKDDGVTVEIEGGAFDLKVGEWSDWQQVSFKISTFKKASGVFKMYLKNLDPFEMYTTTIQVDPSQPLFPISYPEDFAKELAEEIGVFYTLGMPEETDARKDDKIDDATLKEQIDQVESERDKIFWNQFGEFKKNDKGVFAFVYDSSDRMQHMFWKQESLDSEDFTVHPYLEEYWMKKDDFLGKLLPDVGDDTLLIIFSDHGFSSFEKAFSVNDWLLENGYLSLNQEILNDEGALFKYVDWDNTKAFSLGFNSIYFNREGREKAGVVPKKEEEALAKEVISKLEEYKDTDTGKEVIHKVYHNSEVYSGEYAQNGPDLIIGYNPGYRTAWQTAVGGFTREVLVENKEAWKGDHLIDPKFVPGMIITNKKLNKENPSVMDIAPTILENFGITPPHNMDGKSLL